MATFIQFDKIVIDNNLNPRVGALDQEKVLEYSANLDSLPAMDVFEIDGKYYLVAGFHRIAAHQLGGRDRAEFNIHRGNREEAAEFADTDNLKHGINLTREEKRAVAQRQIARHSRWADSRLAASCYTTDKTIRKFREEMEAAGQIEYHDILVGADGIERPRTVPRPRPEPEIDERQEPLPDNGDWMAENHATEMESDTMQPETLLADPDKVEYENEIGPGEDESAPDDKIGPDEEATIIPPASPPPPIEVPPKPTLPPPPPPTISAPPVIISITIRPGPELAARPTIIGINEEGREGALRQTTYAELGEMLAAMLERHFEEPAQVDEETPVNTPEWLVAK